MNNSRIHTHLGIVGALLLPTLAVAAVDIPNVFAGGDPVSAEQMNANFDAVAEALDALESSVGAIEALEARVTALETEVAEIPAVDLQLPMALHNYSALTATDVVAVYQVHTDGIMTFSPMGNGLGSASARLDVGTGTDYSDPAAPAVTCELASCRVSRNTNGGGVIALVPAGSYVALVLNNLEGTTRADLNWQPLHGPDPEGMEPELQRVATVAP